VYKNSAYATKCNRLPKQGDLNALLYTSLSTEQKTSSSLEFHFSWDYTQCYTTFYLNKYSQSRSRWPRCLRRKFETALFLRVPSARWHTQVQHPAEYINRCNIHNGRSSNIRVHVS